MKTETPLGAVSIEAAAALVAHIFVGLDGDVCGAGAKALGVTPVEFASGEQASAVISGVVLVLSGDAVTAGDPVKSDAAGKAVPALDASVTVPSGSTPVTSTGAQPTLVVAGSVLPEVINGYAIDTAATTGLLIRVLLV